MAIQYTYWKEPDGMYLGFLNEYTDHWTQGKDLAELEYMLGDLLDLIRSGDLGDDVRHCSTGSFVHA